MATNTEAKKTGCTTCGALYDHGAAYCGVDGSVLKDSGGVQASDIGNHQHKCTRCNSLYPSYARFCPHDGTKLTSVTEASGQQAARQGVKFNKQDDEVIGKVFADKYKITGLLGEGGMAKVYAATHLQIDKQVVIKLMHQQIPTRDKETTLKRFLQEIKVSAQLNHPNLVSVFDGGDIDGRPYLVMEYIKGQSLRDYIAEKGSCNFQDSITIVSQICAGLQEAHQSGIVHRDLKPENIMLRPDSDRPDWVKIVDFGIAWLKSGGSKLTATGIAIGTVDYMSPEYLADKPIDQRADLYAVGVILFELLTGRCPFEAESAEAVMVKHLWTSPMPPSHSRADMQAGCALDKVVERSLQKEPDQRYQTAGEMRKALTEALKNPAKAP